MDFNEIMRTTDKVGLLLNNLEKRIEYRHKRNVTSHVYDEARAFEVAFITDAFKEEAEYLLKELKK
jgi:hypothetical protein